MRFTATACAGDRKSARPATPSGAQTTRLPSCVRAALQERGVRRRARSAVVRGGLHRATIPRLRARTRHKSARKKKCGRFARDDSSFVAASRQKAAATSTRKEPARDPELKTLRSCGHGAQESCAPTETTNPGDVWPCNGDAEG